MSTLLQERAEDFDFEALKAVYLPNNSFKNRLLEYLLSDEKEPRFILGPKGVGKTLNVLLSLSEAIVSKPEFLPVMFIYKDRNRLEHLNPDRLASQEIWKGRYQTLKSCSSKEELMQKANAIVYDDLHWIFEAMVEGRIEPQVIIEDLKRILFEVNQGKKAILISESPLNLYNDILNIKELSELLPKFGQYPKSLDRMNLEEQRKIMDEMHYIAQLEVPKPSFEDWKQLFNIYCVDADEEVRNLLYNSSTYPRAFIKFMKLFQSKLKMLPSSQISTQRGYFRPTFGEITLEDVKKKTYEMLQGKLRKRDLEINGLQVLISNFTESIDFRTLNILEDLGGYANLMKFHELVPSLENAWNEVKGRLTRNNRNDLDAKMKIDIKLKKGQKRPERVIWDSITRNFDEKNRETAYTFLRNFITKYSFSLDGLNVAGYVLTTLNNQISNSPEPFPPDLPSKLGNYIELILRRVSKIPLSGDSYGKSYYFMIKPFQEAFHDVLYERSTTEILNSYMRMI